MKPLASGLVRALRRAQERLETDPGEAARRAEAILRAAPRHPGATFLLAGARWRQGAPAEALALIAPLAKAEPGNAVVQYELGETLAALGRTSEAISAFRRAVDARSNMALAWRALGDLLFLSGDRAAADEAYRCYVAAAIDEPIIAVAAAAMERGRPEEAEPSLRRHLAARPHDVRALTMLADALMRRRAFAEAAVLLETVLDRHPGYVAARHGRAHAHFKLGQPVADVIADLTQVLAAEPNNADAWALLGSAFMMLSDAQAAAEAYAKSLAADPGNPERMVLYAEQLKYAGRREDAIAGYRRAIAVAPRHGEAWFRLGDVKTYRFTAEEENIMRALVASDDLDLSQRAYLYYALARARADAGDHGQAFADYAAGAALQRSLLPCDPTDSAIFTVGAHSLFAPSFFVTRAGRGQKDPDPIFVVGLPRSGSTLVEQILASHSQVEGTTELHYLDVIVQRLAASIRTERYPELLADLSPSDCADLGEAYLEAARGHRRLGRPHFIDKKPENFQHVGLIHLILPNARVVDVRRSPMSSGFSIFRQHFGEGRRYSYDLEEIGRFYRDYVDLMAVYDAALPGRVHRVIYDDLVSDTEAVIRRLLDYCGLPFEVTCLRFHETSRAVMTPSAEQVRRPIFTGAVEEWQAYEPWLGALKEGLGPALDDWRG
jgi:predicted Zn-dependent protease